MITILFIVFLLSQIVVKIGILAHSNQFNETENNLATIFVQRFNFLAKMFLSFHLIQFSYDDNFLISLLEKLRNNLKALLTKHLTQKSINRIDFVFNFLTHIEFLDQLFKSQEGEMFRLRSLIANDVNKLIEEGQI